MMKKIFESIYTIITMITMCVGFLVAMLFLLGIIVGGTVGSTLAVFAGKIISWAIIFATLAVLVGIVHIYVNKKHTLTIDGQDE